MINKAVFGRKDERLSNCSAPALGESHLRTLDTRTHTAHARPHTKIPSQTRNVLRDLLMRSALT
jgi:hypothetical protein